jgi:hypothetical protein
MHGSFRAVVQPPSQDLERPLCRAPMAVDRCEPHFKESSLVATYRCLACGLLDRAQI